jgi:hypothetical protein
MNLTHFESWQDGDLFRTREDGIRCPADWARAALMELLARLKPRSAEAGAAVDPQVEWFWHGRLRLCIVVTGSAAQQLHVAPMATEAADIASLTGGSLSEVRFLYFSCYFLRWRQ